MHPTESGFTESGFNEEVYLATAHEHRVVTQNLFTHGHYATAAYLVGVAVECLFLAYLMQSGQVQNTGHSLFGLSRSERDRLDEELRVL